MKIIPLQYRMSEDEYFLFEEKAEAKHELINGNLYEMSGVSIFHNNLVLRLSMFVYSLLKGSEWQLTLENFKVKNSDGNFFYPDIAVCYPNVQKHYSEKPILIIEVLSDTTRKYELVDKFIQYQKLETLDYYLCVEQEQHVAFFYQKQEDGEWIAETFTKDDQQIQFPKISISLSLKNIYTP